MTDKPDPYVANHPSFGDAIAQLTKQFFDRNPGIDKFTCTLNDGTRKGTRITNVHGRHK